MLFCSCNLGKHHVSDARCLCLQLELLKMGQTGELKQLWDAASVTNVRINLVRLCTTPSETQRIGTYLAA